ncbi:hypothetical protein EG68_04984 [Paragonimus skrjabini miyazakii]|uniref:Uncharacterized protein n=1 Tax=Paragonimus skrjabini miyazakii TaxID=59628 RepID=A0A8S9YVA0_9TREM|nr:hypothetical protein EG68_04984 [Paragonimus skrjabini miyazakii]
MFSMVVTLFRTRQDRSTLHSKHMANSEVLANIWPTVGHSIGESYKNNNWYKLRSLWYSNDLLNISKTHYHTHKF